MFTSFFLKPAPEMPLSSQLHGPCAAQASSARIPWRGIFLTLTIALIAFGAWSLFKLLIQVTFTEWLTIMSATCC